MPTVDFPDGKPERSAAEALLKLSVLKVRFPTPICVSIEGAPRKRKTELSKKKIGAEELNQILSPIELTEHNTLSLSPGCSFVATIDGKDHLSKFGCFALALHYESDDPIFYTETGRASRDGSHNEALVVAVLRVVQLAPVNAKIEFHSTSSYIVETINELRTGWKEKGWQNNKGERPKHFRHWREIDADVETKDLRISAKHIGNEVAENTAVMKFLRESADHECKRFISSVGG